MSSVFTSRVTKVVPIPHDEGQSATIRKLAPKALEKAAKAAQAASIATLREMGGPAFLKELQGLGDGAAKDKVKAATEADPLLLFDRTELLKAGVMAWTYEDSVSPAMLEDLDEETQDLLAREVLRLSKPALFVSAEVEQKNG